jgi:hypothetical protein
LINVFNYSNYSTQAQRVPFAPGSSARKKGFMSPFTNVVRKKKIGFGLLLAASIDGICTNVCGGKLSDLVIARWAGVVMPAEASVHI